MKLNHIDLQVSDVTRAREYFEHFFDFRCVHQRGEELAMLEDGAGMSLAVSNLFHSPPPVYPPDFHIGFVLETERDVRAHHDRLVAAGVPIKAELSATGPNLYFMCLGPDSILVEVRAPREKPERGATTREV